MGLFNPRGSRLTLLIVVIAGLNFSFFGYDQGFFGGVIGSAHFQELANYPTPNMLGLLAAIYDIGCSVGAVLAFMFGEDLGRKRSIIYADFVMIVGAIIQATSYGYWQMFASRIISGVGVGFATVAVPIIQSETVPAHKRGALLMLQGLTVGIGIALASWLCFAASFSPTDFDWRFPVAFSAVGPIIALILIPGLPESPRWLARKGRVSEARQVIARLLDRPEDAPEVNGQMNEILENLEAEKTAGEPSWTEVFTNSTPTRNLQRVVMGMVPFLMNQWSGINTLAVYLAFVLQNYLNQSPRMALILASTCFTQFTLVGIPVWFYLDRLGRRWSTIISSAGCAVCMALVAGCMLSGSFGGSTAAVLFIFLFFDFFMAGILPVSWLYSAEIQPLVVRNKATAVGVFSHWMSNFVIVWITPPGLSSMGTNFFWIWAAVCASFVPIIYVFAVESSGRTLEQVDLMFLEEPRLCMGLNPRHRKVIRSSAAAEDERRREFAQHDTRQPVACNEKDTSVAEIEKGA